MVGKTETEMKAEKVVGDAKSGDQETPVATSDSKPTSGSESKANVEKMETKKSEKPVAVDKELLQACVEICLSSDFVFASFCFFIFYFCSFFHLNWFPFSRLSGFLTGIELDTSG